MQHQQKSVILCERSFVSWASLHFVSLLVLCRGCCCSWMRVQEMAQSKRQHHALPFIPSFEVHEKSMTHTICPNPKNTCCPKHAGSRMHLDKKFGRVPRANPNPTDDAAGTHPQEGKSVNQPKKTRSRSTGNDQFPALCSRSLFFTNQMHNKTQHSKRICPFPDFSKSLFF